MLNLGTGRRSTPMDPVVIFPVVEIRYVIVIAAPAKDKACRKIEERDVVAEISHALNAFAYADAE